MEKKGETKSNLPSKESQSRSSQCHSHGLLSQHYSGSMKTQLKKNHRPLKLNPVHKKTKNLTFTSCLIHRYAL